jgi:hypothetical protein
MERKAIERMTAWMRGLVLPIVLVAFLSFGADAAIGAAIGGAIALANWAVITWVARRLLALEGFEGRQQMVAGLLLVKVLGVLAILAIAMRLFDVRGLLLGVSTMFLGVVAGAIHTQVRSGDADASADTTPSGRKD